ncbi:UDP-N-acetylglucosamine--N-acetylmuramyl-(pentapeptide) pyrophosphoryl-undecaprenol N-acetylglucosamine transferase [Candidatus Daviesbacteria bacterium]|nr:UDP-N-acetylglucosamine--N-acetylmuramyl-(pentapeptide) pyrophosphoryl-undecaprenol N-acetylglucosamine transferase [Candidatus Daviesbacteria bacterium]
MKVLITGGHVTPAQAVIEQLRKKQGVDIAYVGRKSTMEGDESDSYEYQVIQKLGIPFFNLITGRLQRKLTPYTLWSLIKIPVGLIHSLSIIIQVKPDVVCAFGGYLSTPICFWAYLFHIPIVIHEQTQTAGFANRINSLFAAKIAVSFTSSLPYFAKGKTVLTGNPLRSAIFSHQITSPEIQEFSNNNLSVPKIYVTGGNQGSHIINQVIFKSLPRLAAEFAIIHQTGDQKSTGDFDMAQNIRLHLPSKQQDRYLPIKFIYDDDIGGVLNLADLVICRSGANTVLELAALGKKAILVPLGISAQGDQAKNALLLQKISGAEIILENDLNEKLLVSKITLLLGQVVDDFKLKAQQYIHPTAASDLAELVIAQTKLN